MPSSSSAPCTVPSSPPRPCRAMKQRSTPSALSSCSGRSAGSNAKASTPCDCRALSTPEPDMMDTSRSAEVPPNSTATLPSDLGSSEGGFNMAGLISVAFLEFSDLAGHGADRAGAHADDDVARLGVVDDGLRQVGHAINEQGPDLAGHAHGAGQGAAVGGHDGGLTGGIDPGQERGVGGAQHLDEVFEAG